MASTRTVRSWWFMSLRLRISALMPALHAARLTVRRLMLDQSPISLAGAEAVFSGGEKRARLFMPLDERLSARIVQTRFFRGNAIAMNCDLRAAVFLACVIL